MNTEHTNQSRQAANAAFEQWWQRHGLEDPMDDEDRYYITASSWARRGYLAAMGLATIKDSLTVAQQAALIENLKVLAKGFGHKTGCAKNAFGEQCTCGVDDAIAAAQQAQQAEPVARDVLMAALNEVKQTIHDYRVTIDDVDLAAIADRHAAQPPAVAVPDGYVLTKIPHEYAKTLVNGGWNQYADGWNACRAAMLAAAPQATAEDSSGVPGNAAQDAARYRLLRLGRCWSVIDGLGAGLQGEELDAAVDVALGSAAQKGGAA